MRSAFLTSILLALQPETNFSRCWAISSRSFFPIALRRVSASPSEKPARSAASFMTCSW